MYPDAAPRRFSGPDAAHAGLHPPSPGRDAGTLPPACEAAAPTLADRRGLAPPSPPLVLSGHAASLTPY